MDNLFASQFHPEKSGEIGLKILNDFFQKREYKER
jgi:imidazoleglycerol phosphate synthase glutamine amidotransferase subunit HisH